MSQEVWQKHDMTLRNIIILVGSETEICFARQHFILAFNPCSLHFASATHNAVTSYHAPQGSQSLQTSEADFVSDLSQGEF